MILPFAWKSEACVFDISKSSRFSQQLPHHPCSIVAQTHGVLCLAYTSITQTPNTKHKTSTKNLFPHEISTKNAPIFLFPLSVNRTQVAALLRCLLSLRVLSPTVLWGRNKASNNQTSVKSLTASPRTLNSRHYQIASLAFCPYFAINY